MTRTVSVAIPVRDGAGPLYETLAAVQAQRLASNGSIELLVCDSGSRDRSVAVARSFGAKVIEISQERFSHGATRNLLMERSEGDHVAFLTQDAVPAHETWLERLLEGFGLTEDVGLVFGPYRPRPAASPMVAREVTEWFRSFSPSGLPRIDRLPIEERNLPARELLGARGFFTDANGCVSRAAWEHVPFRPVAYAEDHVLAHDMMRAGYAKVFVPDAAVIHSHEYSSWDWLRRSFDEARALRAVYGYAPPAGLPHNAKRVRALVGADWRWFRATKDETHGASLLARSARHHVSRTIGAMLGARAERLPDTAVRRLSLERRANATVI